MFGRAFSLLLATIYYRVASSVELSYLLTTVTSVFLTTTVCDSFSSPGNLPSFVLRAGRSVCYRIELFITCGLLD